MAPKQISDLPSFCDITFFSRKGTVNSFASYFRKSIGLYIGLKYGANFIAMQKISIRK
jgi:hypothetical protein